MLGLGPRRRCPPGHGDIYPSLLGSGMLDRLIDGGHAAPLLPLLLLLLVRPALGAASRLHLVSARIPFSASILFPRHTHTHTHNAACPRRRHHLPVCEQQ